MSTPATTIRPAVGWSSPAMRPSSVDLPLPDGPAMARNWPAGTSRETSVSTSTPRPPLARRMREPADADHARDPYYTSDMRALLGRLLLLVQLAVVACAPAPAAAQAQDRVIVAFGDSLTSGLGVPADQTYPALLGERLRREGYAYRVVNAGVVGRHHRGRAAARGLGAAPQARDRDRGAGRQRRPPRPEPGLGARQPGSAIVARFQAAGARVLVAGMRLPPNYGTPYADDFYRLFSEVARARNAPYLPFFLDGVGAIPRLNQADGIHPTAEGYALVVEHLWPFLVPLLRK